MAELIIRPELFAEGVTAFFTGKEPGADAKSAAAVAGVGVEQVYMPLQKHTGDVEVLDGMKEPAVADAVVSGMEGVLLGVQVADCVPILLYDGAGGSVGAVHAGWRGTAAGIIKNAIYALAPDGTGDVRVALGPAIRWCCYGVGRDVLESVIEATGDGDYHKERDGTLCLDLPSANRVQAVSAGVPARNVWTSDECTFCYPDRFHSYRYTKSRVGRQGGFILKH